MTLWKAREGKVHKKSDSMQPNVGAVPRHVTLLAHDGTLGSKERLLGVSLFAVVGTKNQKCQAIPHGSPDLWLAPRTISPQSRPGQAWKGCCRSVPRCGPRVGGVLLTRTLPGMQLSECGRREGTMPPVRSPRCGAQRATVANSCCSTGPHPAMDGHA